MYNGSYCDQKSQLSEIFTEPLNPRELFFFKLLQTMQKEKVPRTYQNRGILLFKLTDFLKYF